MVKRIPRYLCILVAALALCPAYAGRAEALSVSMKGEEVWQLKLRLFDLGYLHTVDKLSKEYTEEFARVVGNFQEASGLARTGVADARTLELAFSSEAVKAPLPEERPTYNTSPDLVLSLPQNLPETDAGGFLTQAGEPFALKDRDAGLWLYISAGMRVEVRRFTQEEGKLEWFEAYVRYRDSGKPESIPSKNDGKHLQDPLHILAGRPDVILAVTDDYYRYRERNDQRVGIVVRDGEIKSDRTYAQRRSRIPSLEVLAMFADGRLKTFASDAYTAQEYIGLGVTDTWAFGPSLVQEGEVPRYYYSDDYRSYKEPRVAIGMMADGSYCALMITGRKEDSRGATFGWMAEKMKEMGAYEAFNLDGGGTAALVFMDELLNHSPNHQDSRALSGLIGFADAPR